MGRGIRLAVAVVLAFAALLLASGVGVAAASGPIAHADKAHAHASKHHKRHHRRLHHARAANHHKRHHRRVAASRTAASPNANDGVTVTVAAGPDVSSAARLASEPAFVGPCANTDIVPTADNMPAVVDATMCLINQQRAAAGEVPLHVNDQLTAAANHHGADMITNDYFAHVSPTGETPLMRDQNAGYPVNQANGYVIGENIAWATNGSGNLTTPASIVQAWMNSPEHRANILDADYRETGVSVMAEAPASVSGGDTGALYTQEFGVLQ